MRIRIHSVGTEGAARAEALVRELAAASVYTDEDLEL